MTTRNTYDWAKFIRYGRGRPSKWWLALADVPVTVMTAVTQQRHPALRVRDGQLEPLLRQPYSTPDGQERGDVWLRFTPFAYPRIPPPMVPIPREVYPVSLPDAFSIPRRDVTVTNKNRHIHFPPQLKVLLAEHAYQQRTNTSAIVRDIVVTSAEQGLTALDTLDLGIGVELTDTLSFVISAESWDTAQERAAADRTTVPEVIRRRVAKLVEDVVLPE